MCFLIVEILLLIAGFWALITGEIPTKLFRVLFGKGDYNATARQARLFGLLLASPIPLTFLGTIIIGILYGSEETELLNGLEMIILIAVCIVAVLIVRSFKSQPADEVIGTKQQEELKTKRPNIRTRIIRILAILVGGFVLIPLIFYLVAWGLSYQEGALSEIIIFAAIALLIILPILNYFKIWRVIAEAFQGDQ